MPVLTAIARTAARLCDAHDAQVYLVEGGTLRLAAQHGSGRTTRRLGKPFPVSAASILGHAVLARRVIHVRDLKTAARTRYPQLAARQQATGVRTTVAAPLLSAGEAIGTIMIRRRQVRPFTSHQIALLKTFADQAAIAIDNAWLSEELEGKNRALTEALEQQTATSRILGVISRSPTEIAPVFEAVVTSAARLCEANDVAMLLVDGSGLRIAAGVGPLYASIPPDFTLRLTRESVATRAVVDRATIHIHDLVAEPDEEYPVGRALARRFGHRSMLAVPLVREGSPIGVICAFRLEVRPFPEQQIALLKTFADQAVIAIENVRLFTELQEKNSALSEALERQTATGDVLHAISRSAMDARPVFQTIAESAVRLSGALFGSVYRFDGELIHMTAHHNYPPAALEFSNRFFPARPSRQSFTGRAILERGVVHVPDVAHDQERVQAAELADAIGLRSVLSVPMLRDGAPIGAITVWRSEVGHFSDQHVGLLQTFAEQAVVAVQNERLFAEVEARNRDLTEALDQQTATSEILGVISRSPTDVQPVFEAIVRSASRLCGGEYAIVTRHDGEFLHLAAQHNPRPGTADETSRIYPQRPLRETSLNARAFVDGKTVHVPDVDNEALDPSIREAYRRIRLRAMLGVPMIHQGRAIGVISISRETPGPFSERQTALLGTFADQAVIAIENVRLFTELQARNHDLTEALERQTATADILRAISQAQTDVQPVFEAIADSAMRLLGAWAAAVTLYDGGLVRLVAALGGLPGSADAFRERGRVPHRPTSPPEQAVVTRRVHHIADVDTDPSCDAQFRRHAAQRGFRAFVSVPMLRGSDPLGMITVSRAQAGEFSPTEIALLQTFADQAVIAVENTRLLAELQARTGDLTRSVSQLTALAEVGRAVSSTLDLETVLTTIVSRAVQLSGLDGGVVFEYHEDAQEFVQRAQADTGGVLAAARRGARIRKGQGVVGRTAITLEPVQVADITVPGAYVGPNRKNLIDSGIRALVAIPMVREGELIGCLGVSRNRAGEFPAETIELLRTFATQSALAIQNARLFHEIEDKSAQLEAASRHKSEFLANMSHELRTPLNAVIGFSEVLLQRMFGELNDKQDEYLKDIYASGQHLLSLINDILDLSKIEAGRMELAAAPFHLPSALDNAVTLVKERAGRHGIALELDLDPGLGELVGDERKVKQVVLNLLSNAVKFTPEGGRIRLTARPRDGAIEIAVADTGVGIAPEDQTAIFEEFRQVGSDERRREGTGLGLALAKKFVELHGGRLWVESEPGAGSTFTFTLPADSPGSR